MEGWPDKAALSAGKRSANAITTCCVTQTEQFRMASAHDVAVSGH